MASLRDLLCAEMYQLRHRKSFWICALFALLVELVNGFLHGGDQVETMTLLLEIIGLLTCALFAGSFVCTDFVNRTIYHTLTAGKSRRCVWISKYLAYGAACLGLLLINILAANVSILIFHYDQLAWSDPAWLSVLGYTFCGIVYDMCLVSLFFLLALQIKENGLTIAIAVVLTALMIASSELLWVDRLLPLLTPQLSLQSIPINNCLLLLLLPCLTALLGTGLFDRCSL